jgi:asparagine synthetase B (glutamine-hydrolysing)
MTTYCILNPNLNNEKELDIYLRLSHCGINIMMDNSNIYKDPNIIILLKGEIYNIHMLCSQMNISLETKPECLIMHLYKKYGIDYILQVLDGVFSFILFDYYFENEISKIYVVSDICGIIPLYSFINNKTIYFTETKTMSDKYKESEKYIENKILPGCYSLYELGNKVSAEWKMSKIVNKPYFLIPNSIVNTDLVDDISKISNDLRNCIKKIVLKIANLSQENVDIIVEQLFSQIYYEEDTKYDVMVFDEISKKQILFSPKHFFIFENENNNLFEHDIIVRNKLYSTDFEMMSYSHENADVSVQCCKKYPFFDKSFIMLYFSIPLHIRYDLPI